MSASQYHVLGSLADEARSRHVAADRRGVPPVPTIPMLPPRAELVRPLTYVFGDQLPDGDEGFDDEIVEGVIGRAAMAVFYGDSNSGKTFLAVDLAGAVSRGAEFLGRRTAAGAVLYLATEAEGSVRLRVRAYQRHHRVKLPHVVIVQSPINLYDGNADVTAVLALIAEIEARLGVTFALVIGDTMARMSAGANENSGEDMGVVLKNADAIRSATGASFLWVHHVGKDTAKGMRGWSGMRAAIDTEIEITADESTGLRSAEITKQRDLPGKGDRLGFRLVPLPMGKNRWGNARTTCVVESSDAPPKRERGKRASDVEGAIVEFLTSRGTGCLRGAMVKHFEGRHARQSVYRTINNMIDAGTLINSGHIVALPGLPGPNA